MYCRIYIVLLGIWVTLDMRESAHMWAAQQAPWPVCGLAVWETHLKHLFFAEMA